MPHTRQEWEETLRVILYEAAKNDELNKIKKWAKEEGFAEKRAHIYIVESLKILNGSVSTSSSSTRITPKVVTIPGTLGEEFDRWMAEGFDAAEMSDANYPNGQADALEIMRGYDEVGADATSFRNRKIDELTTKQRNMYGMMRKRYLRWAQYHR
jgi:hypothetical protein